MILTELHRRINGHHFGDLLTCPQRAWLAYHGDYALRLRDPAPLRSLQQAGIEHEAAVYGKLYPGVLRVPENLPAPDRAAQTVEAMRAGESVILQGYVSTPDGIGILDVLQLAGPDVSSSTGRSYRVGEIKRSAALRTAHVFQACWYTELLERMTGQTSGEAFFILADGQPQVVDLSTVRVEYETARSELYRLRASAEGPGPHFGPPCLTCAWRGVCLPELVACEHPSLLPGVTRRQVEELRRRGIATWRAVGEAGRALWEQVGLPPMAAVVLPEALARLQSGRPALRTGLRPGLFRGAIAVALEFPDLAERLRTEQDLEPSAIYFDDGTTAGTIPCQPSVHPDLTPLLGGRRLVTFGALDSMGLRYLLRKEGITRRGRLLDLLELLEKHLHYPTLGLDLETLTAHAGGMSAPASSANRASAVRRVLDWIA